LPDGKESVKAKDKPIGVRLVLNFAVATNQSTQGGGRMVALPFRQIHLDFHTSPLIPDVAAEFDPDEFARTLKDAFVNSVTVFAKCHHGMSYYDTKVGIKHPALKRDLLGEMIAACHRYGIRTPVYISVVWDNWAAEHHPEWRQVNREGKFVGAEPFQAGWRWLCLNTGYADYVAAQTEEVVKGYEVDGVFFDIVMQWECYCEKCRRDMLAQGLDPENAEHARQFARQVCQRFMGRVNEIVHRHRPNATVYHNSRLRIGTSREAHLYTHQEIESLPTGGWGYLHFPFFARYVRTVWREFLGMTARFHRSWADFGTLKTEAALAYECFHALALGGKCSIGDQLHPRGKLDKTVYDASALSSAHRRVGRVVRRAEGVAEIAI
jgi:Alpha-L-fucosidase